MIINMKRSIIIAENINNTNVESVYIMIAFGLWRAFMETIIFYIAIV